MQAFVLMVWVVLELSVTGILPVLKSDAQRSRELAGEAGFTFSWELNCNRSWSSLANSGEGKERPLEEEEAGPGCFGGTLFLIT